MSLNIELVPTTPFSDQKPGTSGLRKKVKTFQQKNYTANFIQSILLANDNKILNSTLIVGGDGRFYSKEAIEIIIQICAANKVSTLIIGRDGIISTPAVSHLIRSHEALGAIILTASHNPGGEENDFGIKFNCCNGGPAPDHITEEIFKLSKQITEYKLCPGIACNISSIGTHTYDIDDHQFIIKIIDPVSDYVNLMKTIFDFEGIKNYISSGNHGKPLKVLIDSMNGVTGPYVRQIFVNELGCPETSITRVEPLSNFGGIHPDPNLTYAKSLVDAVREGGHDLGAAFDGDGDRNMIIGHDAIFVTPSDSLAVLAHFLKCIPYFVREGVKGFARSMPTAAAVDRVASRLGVQIYEVPTGWKYFGNLMDSGKLSLCGEESFGTGSDHIREKDGIWAALAWLSVMRHTQKGVGEILLDHWKLYGRNYFTRYDYEECSSNSCAEMVKHLKSIISDKNVVGRKLSSLHKEYIIKIADDFSYRDPIDDTYVSGQGIRFIFDDDSRIIFRLSGTGSSGSTVRLYVDSYESKEIDKEAKIILRPLVELALNISKLYEFTGRTKPSVIT